MKNNKDERKIVLQNQISIQEIMGVCMNSLKAKNYVVMTPDGDYFFERRVEADEFASRRNGYVETMSQRNNRIKTRIYLCKNN